MTREEIIEYLDILKKSINETVGNRLQGEFTYIANVRSSSTEFVIQSAIKALKRESCEDTISRQAVEDLLEKYSFNRAGWYTFAYQMAKDLKDLPSVQTKAKVGHWIKKENEMCFTCDQCWITNASGVKYNFCPNCGADMEVKSE